MKNLTIILPVHEEKIFSNYINYNLTILSSIRIKVLVISPQKKKFIENNYIKYIANKNLTTAHKKIEYALRYISTKYVYFLREDILLHKYGFIKNFNKLKNNRSIICIQGIQFLAANTKYKLIFPHGPNNHNEEMKLSKMTVQEKISNILNKSPECYWTFHTTKVVKKFFHFYFKKGYFKDPNIYDYYFIFFLLAYGNICFSNIPINLKIKRAKAAKNVKYEDHKRNKNFYYTLDLLSKNFSKRKISKNIAKKLLLESFNKRIFLPKPRDILINYNTFEKVIHVIKKIIIKMVQKYYFRNLIISQYDIYYISKLNSFNYKKIINNKLINMGFKILLKKLIDPNKLL